LVTTSTPRPGDQTISAPVATEVSCYPHQYGQNETSPQVSNTDEQTISTPYFQTLSSKTRSDPIRGSYKRVVFEDASSGHKKNEQVFRCPARQALSSVVATSVQDRNRSPLPASVADTSPHAAFTPSLLEAAASVARCLAPCSRRGTRRPFPPAPKESIIRPDTGTQSSTCFCVCNYVPFRQIPCTNLFLFAPQRRRKSKAAACPLSPHSWGPLNGIEEKPELEKTSDTIGHKHFPDTEIRCYEA